MFFFSLHPSVFIIIIISKLGYRHHYIDYIIHSKRRFAMLRNGAAQKYCSKMLFGNVKSVSINKDSQNTYSVR